MENEHDNPYVETAQEEEQNIIKDAISISRQERERMRFDAIAND